MIFDRKKIIFNGGLNNLINKYKNKFLLKNQINNKKVSLIEYSKYYYQIYIF